MHKQQKPGPFVVWLAATIRRLKLPNQSDRYKPTCTTGLRVLPRGGYGLFWLRILWATKKEISGSPPLFLLFAVTAVTHPTKVLGFFYGCLSAQKLFLGMSLLVVIPPLIRDPFLSFYTGRYCRNLEFMTKVQEEGL